MSIELDHVFWMVARAEVDAVARRLVQLGLRESYRRRHVGQGTSNICYCFDNAFFELLWIEDEAEARSAAIARTGLADRLGPERCPIGLAWRGDFDVDTWAFQPPYLPASIAIDVATASDDVCQLFAFTFPGSKAPRHLPADRFGGGQSHAGWARLDIEILTVPSDPGPHPDLRRLCDALGVDLVTGQTWELTLLLGGETKKARLSVPRFEMSAV